MDNKENKKVLPESPIDSNPPLDEDISKVSQTGPDYKKYAVIACVILLITLINLRSCFKKDNNALPTATSVSQIPDYHDVTKPEIYKQKDIKKTKIEKKEDPELLKIKLAYLAQQQKMYRMRQNAPIDLLKNDDSGSSSHTSSLFSNVSKSANVSAGNGRLPLSQTQIATLRRAQGADPDEAFQERVKSEMVETTQAVQIPFQNETIAQGTLIPGVLQTAINSDLPGMLKANVSEDIYSIDGNAKLIPKGSILVGQYSSGLMMGQKRVLVMWTRLIRPDGVYVMLGSPGTDSLGRSGLGADVLQTQFWERFGQAALLSIIGTGIATAGVDDDAAYNSASEYRIALSSNFQSSANQTLASTLNQKPTIHVYQGSKINVFVNRDLSFHHLTQQKGESYE